MSETQPTTQGSKLPARQLCYIRKARDGALINGETDGWVLEPRLICDQVTVASGARMGTADFTVTPQQAEVGVPAESHAIEDLLSKFSTDDQVRVVVEPYLDPAGGGAVTPIFEGVLQRHRARIVSQANGRGESVALFAWPMPAAIDARGPAHLIRGRWISDLRTPARPTSMGANRDVYVVESPVLPAIFNFRGRPNKHPQVKLRCGPQGDKQIESPVFTHDYDVQGEWWTVGDALAAIVAVWGLGPTEHTPAPRNFDIEERTLAALKDPNANDDDSNPRFRGLSEALPELSVHGLGVFEALEAVCKVTDFEFSVTPTSAGPALDLDLPSDGPDPDQPEQTPTYDRRYILTIWRKGEGDIKWFSLDKRDQTYESSEDFAAKNDLRTLETLRDGRDLVNVIYGVGRELIEARIELKPLWDPQEFDQTKPKAVQIDPDEDELKTPGTYAARHCAGGVDFEQFGIVGRRWGVDCTGMATAYTEGDYAQPAGGFNWLVQLGLFASTEPYKWRLDRKVQEQLRWTLRPRPLLPLRSPEARAASIEYFLEVSENGSSYFPVPKNLRYAVLREPISGIMLGVGNLCAVNMTTLATGEPLNDVELSWWNLIRLEVLRFRITCCVEADHAFRVDAPRQPASGSVYEQAQHVIWPIERVWVQPATKYNAGTTWKDIPGWADAAKTDGQDPDLEALVKRRQEALQSLRQTGRGDLRDLDFSYEPGQRIAGVRHRGVDFSLGAGRSDSFPNIASVTWTLSTGVQQATQVVMTDDTYAPAVVGGKVGGSQ